MFLFSLGLLKEFETLLSQLEGDEKEKYNPLFKVLNKEWEEVDDLIEDSTENIDRLYLKTLAKIKTDPESKWKKIVELIDRINQEASHPIHFYQAATLSVQFLIKVVQESLTVNGLDRERLVRSAKENVKTAIQKHIEVNENEYGLSLAYSSAAELYDFLREEENYEFIVEKLDQLAESIGRPIYISGEIETEKIDQLFQEGVISQDRQLYLRAVNLEAQNKKERAKSLLSTAFELSTDESLRVTIANKLINIHLENDDYVRAEEVIESLENIRGDAIELLRGLIIQERKGLESIIEFLENALDSYPKSRLILENLIRFTIRKIREDKNKSKKLFKKCDEYISRLVEILPCPENKLKKADLLYWDNQLREAVEVINDIFESGYESVSIRSKKAGILFELQKSEKAGNKYIKLYEDYPKKTEFAQKAALIFLESANYSKALNFLNKCVQKGETNPYIIFYLGISHLFSDIGDSQEAYNNLLRVEKSDISVPDIHFLLHIAANKAGLSKESSFHFSKVLENAEQKEISSETDLNELFQDGSKGQMQLAKFNLDSIKKLVKRENERVDAINTFLSAELMSYADVFKQNGRAFQNWIQWQTRFKNSKVDFSKGFSIRMPWPNYKDSLKSLESLSAKDGILIDYSAILTLGSISKPSIIIQKLSESGIKIYLPSNLLSHIRDELHSNETQRYLGDQKDYIDQSELIDQYFVKERYEGEKVAKQKEKALEKYGEEIGNEAYDLGLAISENANYVRDIEDEKEIDDESFVINSKSLLRILYDKGIIPRSKCENASKRFRNIFEGWEEAKSFELKEEIVFSSYSLGYWFSANLFEERIVKKITADHNILVGPFAWGIISNNSEKQKIAQEAYKSVKRIHSLLDENIDKGNIELIEKKALEEDKNIVDEELINLWEVSLSNIKTASKKSLSIWVDDSFYSYFLFDYGMPFSIPEFESAGRSFINKYSSPPIHSTEDIIEYLAKENLDNSEANKYGWELFEKGYKPLTYELTFNHLLNEFKYNEEQPQYANLFTTLENLDVTIKQNEAISDNNRRALTKAASAVIFPKLIVSVWYSNQQDKQQKIDISNKVLQLYESIFHEVQAEGDYSSDRLLWESLISQVITKTKDEKIDVISYLNWLKDAVLKEERILSKKEIALAIENFVTYFFSKSEELSEISSSDDGVTNITTQIIPFIIPFFSNEFVEQFSSLFRISVGVLANEEDDFLLETHYQIKNWNEEVEEIRYADKLFNNFINGQLNYIPINGLNIIGRWEKEVSEEKKRGLLNLPINFNLLEILLLDEAEDREKLFDVVYERLLIFDPHLSEILYENRDSLLDTDDEVRNIAHQELIIDLLSSVYYQFYRSFRFAIEQLRTIKTTDLDKFLIGSEGSDRNKKENSEVIFINGHNYPVSYLRTQDFISLKEDKIKVYAEKHIDHFRSSDQQEEILLNLINHVTRCYNPFEMGNSLLIMLMIINEISAEQKIKINGENITIREWVKKFIENVLSSEGEYSGEAFTDQNQLLKRNKNISKIYIYLWKCSVYCTGSAKHINYWKKISEGSEQKAIKYWINSSLIFNDRVVAYLWNYYSDYEHIMEILSDTTDELNIPKDEPIDLIDVLNPYLFGPKLIDLDVLIVLHVLNLTWNELHDGESPFWWNQEIESLLREIANKKQNRAEEIFKSSFTSEKFNSMNTNIDSTPKEMANILLQRKEGS